MVLEELPYWLALWRVKGIGTSHFRDITEHFPCIREFFELPLSQLKALGLKEAQSTQIASFQNGKEPIVSQGVERDLEWLEQSRQHHIITWSSDDYPPLLREIVGSPPILFVDGNVGCLTEPQIAIVGSRHPSRQGKQVAYDFSSYLAKNGFIPTSGLALGIDACAHSGALANQTKTIAVLAHGLDSLYPVRNKSIGRQIPEKGALVSEFPIGVVPRPEYFPRRNRIISGLSLGVLVVEAAIKSGSLITAHEAADQGREVFAIPGSINDPLAKGCHSLIRNGAKLVETAQDVVDELRPLLGFMQEQLVLPVFSPKEEQERSESLNVHQYAVGSPESRLLAALEYDSTSVDQLVGITGLSVADISSALIMLELDGLVSQQQGEYSRI